MTNLDSENNINPNLVEPELNIDIKETDIKIKQETDENQSDCLDSDHFNKEPNNYISTLEVNTNIKIEFESDPEDTPDIVKFEDYPEDIKQEIVKKEITSEKPSYYFKTTKTTAKVPVRRKKRKIKHKNYTCAVCEKSYGQKQNLKLHIYTQHNRHIQISKPKSIIKMEKNESKEKVLTTIKKKSENKKKKKYNCTVCHKILTGITSIQRHMLIHTGERSYTCIPCNRSFALKSSLKKHERTHRDKEYKCSFCTKVLTSQAFLFNHQKLHIIERKYTCTVCNCNFGLESSLRRHEVKHRADFRKHNCSFCKRVFNSGDTLSIHLQSHAGEENFKTEEEIIQFDDTSLQIENKNNLE